MKAKIIIFLITGILIGAAATYFIAPLIRPTAEVSESGVKQLYSCGMHPEVISEEPGNCPICGMKLTPIKGSQGEQSEAAKKDRSILYWQAPMDPTEIYDNPGKSKMGMDLIPVYEGDEAGGAGSITIDGAVQQNMNLRTAKVERRDMSRVIKAFGKVTIAQDKEFSINTKIQGWVEKLYVNTIGQKVRKGQPLMEVYSPELVSTQEEYLQALKNYRDLADNPRESIKKNAARMLEMTKNRLAFWDISEAEIALIEKNGKAKRVVLIRSTADGIVTHKAIVEGDRVGPGMDLFHIADLSRVWVEAAIYEGDLPLISEGLRAELALDFLPSRTFEGKVDFVYPYLDKMSRSNSVRILFENKDQVLKPDMFATVRIFSRAVENAIAIPSEAVIHSGTRQIAFVTRGDGKFEPREIKTGMETDDGYVEILSGLFDEDQVVVSGQFLLDSESKTREAIAKMREAQKKDRMEAESAQKKEAMEMPAVEAGHEHEAGKSAPVEAGHSHETATVDPDRLYVCPMHPGFMTTDPEAPCPECGMKLVKLTELKDKAEIGALTFYTCPMHPEFLTTDPEGRCPECGMKLEKVKK